MLRLPWIISLKIHSNKRKNARQNPIKSYFLHFKLKVFSLRDLFPSSYRLIRWQSKHKQPGQRTENTSHDDSDGSLQYLASQIACREHNATKYVEQEDGDDVVERQHRQNHSVNALVQA